MSNIKEPTKKAMIRQIKKNEKDAIYKADADARQAVKAAIENKELAIIKARADEGKMMRDMLMKTDDAIKVIRETELKAIDNAKNNRKISVKAAKDIEEQIIKDAYDAEAKGIIGADKKSVRRIKYGTLRTIQRAKIVRDSAIWQALLYEKNTIDKALQTAYRDKKKAEKDKKRAKIYASRDAGETKLKAIEIAWKTERDIVNGILLNHKITLEDIKKKARKSLSAIKSGRNSAPKFENKITVETEETYITGMPLTPETKEATEEQSESEITNTVFQTLEDIEMCENTESSTTIEEAPVAVDSIKESEEPAISEVKELAKQTKNDLKEIKNLTINSNPESVLYKGMIKVIVGLPTEPFKIKTLGDKLKDIENLRVLVISGCMGKNTEITLSLNEYLPLVDILDSMPEVNDITIKGKDIFLTLY
ncbi:MAG: hypothetical protein PHE15_06770 [Dehalococcoidales bacterium]|nr:hypothetical protein [Dehalococcoidales bacterium]